MTLRARRLAACGALLAAIAATFVLYHFPPENTSFYPRCPVFLWLHVYCPGCGGTRAMAALLHGRMREALHFNAAVVAALPFAGTFFVIAFIRAMRPRPFVWPAVPQRALAPLLLAIAMFTVMRNF